MELKFPISLNHFEFFIKVTNLSTINSVPTIVVVSKGEGPACAIIPETAKEPNNRDVMIPRSNGVFNYSARTMIIIAIMNLVV